MAHIISFPNSAAAPVQQKRGPGRHPQMVVQLWKLRHQKKNAAPLHSAEFLIGMEQGRRAAELCIALGPNSQGSKTMQEQLASQRELLLTCEELLSNVRAKVAVLEQRSAYAQDCQS